MASKKYNDLDDTKIVYVTRFNGKVKTHTGYWYPHHMAFRSAMANKNRGVEINCLVRLKEWKR